jgi:RNA polymerase sigma-70 factor (ECF subfamily)
MLSEQGRRGGSKLSLPASTPPTFGAVYRATSPLVRRSARWLGIPTSAVDDVVQDVFLTVHRRLAQFGGRSSVENWVFGILLRVAGNYRRTRRRKGAAHAITSKVGDPDELFSCDDPMDTVSLREAKSILCNALGKLNPRHSIIWIMATLDDSSPSEIAQELGITVFTVYSRLKAARSHLSRELGRLSLMEEARLTRRRLASGPLAPLTNHTSSAA